ncbi:MAG TPA: HD domain-containing phosphohydrolase [Thermoanaerobaculia bacterium]|nr:HD domain-containing phosphohydrolase [Thermoanaerobaculia bacterium]
MSGRSGHRRIRLFVLLTGALVLASLIPLAVAEAVLIRRNRRTLETLEEKYLTRSSAAIADHIAAYYASAGQQLTKAADAIRLAVQLTGKDPFGTAGGPEILGSALSGQTQLSALRGVNLDGRGSFVGPDVKSADVDFEFRKGFESARDGLRYEGSPFPVVGLGTVAVLAQPVVDEKGTRIGVVEALVSWGPMLREFEDEARREARATLVDRQGHILFPPASGGRGPVHPSTLVADFVRFPARLTRSEKGASGDVLASIAPVGDPPWGVLVERDRDIAFASVDGMVRDTVLWSAACLAGALALGVLFARRLSRPIARLAESTRAVAGGQYGTSVEVTGTAEIADLSENFNVMSASIRDAFERVQRAARENQELFISSIRALAAAIDAKDPYTRGHSERVARYSAAIAKELALPAEEARKVRLSALLHDVGKIGVDDRIIRKPTALTDEEFDLMKAHPVKGAAIMETIPQMADIIPGMKYHHEKWEGGGYPDGLKGEQIPLQARIVAVADAFDAMTTTRPYQKAMEVSYVLERLREMSGKRFDGGVVEALARSHGKGELVPAEAASLPRVASRAAAR